MAAEVAPARRQDAGHSALDDLFNKDLLEDDE